MKAGIYPNEHIIKIDNYALSEFRTCPRKFQHRIVESLVPGGFTKTPGQLKIPDPPLLFGIAIHQALDSLFMEESLPLAIDVFLEAFQPVPEDKKRTPGRGIRLLENYAKQWQTQDKIYDTIQSELYFEFDLDVVSVSSRHRTSPSTDWKIVYGGLIDKILSHDDQFICMDHKTSTWESQYLVPSHQLSNQFIGYIWATQQIPEYSSCEHFIADILLMSPKNDSFYRSELDLNTDVVNEWKQGIMVTCSQIIQLYSADFFPMYGKDACTSWNRLCPYFDICGATHDFRSTVKSTQYSKLIWDTAAR